MPDAVLQRVREVIGPEPVLSRERQSQLTQRQRELLDQLSNTFRQGFNHVTMADLANELGCSLRTLYALAPSRDELVLVVVDRNLWQIGRTATAAVTADMAPLAAIRAYLAAANVAVADTTEAFARDCESLPRTRELSEHHSNHLIAVTQRLLDLAVERGEIGQINTSAVARVIAGVGRDFARPEVLPTLGTRPKEAADEVTEIILAGLRHSAPVAARREEPSWG